MDEAGRHPQREILSPLEASHGQFLIPTPSHFKPQKVRGFVERLFVNEGYSTPAWYQGCKFCQADFGVILGGRQSGKLSTLHDAGIPYLGGPMGPLKVNEACQGHNPGEVPEIAGMVCISKLFESLTFQVT
jgi:hypothetical protein